VRETPGAWWGASVGAALVYTSAVLFSFPPALHFFPRLGSWGFAALPEEPSIRWYGWIIETALGGLLGFAIGRFVKRPPWGLTWLIAVACLLALAWHERHWFLR
jgi:hypothetical protein